MPRIRFNENPVDELLTFSEYIGMYYEEPVILHYTAQKLPFTHWSDHLNHFWYSVTKEEPHNTCDNNFDMLKKEVKLGLRDYGFLSQVDEVESCRDEIELNRTIIRQYTDETDLYKLVNSELRSCHLIQREPDLTEEFIENHSCKLSAWILQLNTAIRRELEYTDTAYRGATLTTDEINMYKVGEIIIWAPFISASKKKTECLGGNVLFEIRTESSISEYGKRYPRSISHLSAFPNEEEVLYPIACAYRVKSIKNMDNKTIIALATVDHN